MIHQEILAKTLTVHRRAFTIILYGLEIPPFFFLFENSQKFFAITVRLHAKFYIHIKTGVAINKNFAEFCSVLEVMMNSSNLNFYFFVRVHQHILYTSVVTSIHCQISSVPVGQPRMKIPPFCAKNSLVQQNCKLNTGHPQRGVKYYYETMVT